MVRLGVVVLRNTTMIFPFEVPADLSTLTAEELTSLSNQVREFAAGLVEEGKPVTEETLDGLRASKELATAIVAASEALDQQQQHAAEAASLLSDISTATTQQPDIDASASTSASDTDDTDTSVSDADLNQHEPAALVASSGRRRAPSVRSVAGRGTTPQLPQDTERRRFMHMRAAANVPTFTAGQRLDRFDDAARALSAQIDQYPFESAGRAIASAGSRNREIMVLADGGRRIPMRDYSRHGAVQFVREFPDELTVRDGHRGMEIAEYAASERRLPGGSLIESARLAVKSGRSLTAAAGWCAPSDTIWDLCELETLDGLLDLPELTTTRGGWQIPANGGPDFSTIWTGLGTTHRTETQVIAESPSKTCYEIPCPSFIDVRLGVDYFCLTGGLLQRRGYPELVARFGRGAMTALAHKINSGVITAIATAAGAANVIPPCATGEDALSSLLAAVEIATVDAKYRNRMGFNTTLEVTLPWWVLAQMRAAASRRSGVDLLAVTDMMIIDWFAIRGAVPRFVYDWQDAYTAAVAGPGGQFASLALPQTVNFLVYPAGTFVKATQNVVNLDTVYDSTKLATNEYTAVFAEDGWAVLQMCPYVRQYTATVDPCSEIGCCPS